MLKVVCLGDSLTRGQVSQDYLELLRARFPASRFVNAGVNLEVTEGLLRRLPAAIAEDADVYTLLIGTNHVRASLDEQDAQRIRQRWALTGPLSEESYRADLHEIVQRLQATRGRVALLSPPVLGEELDSVPLQRSVAYSRIVEEVARERGVAYLPLNEAMRAFLQTSGRAPGTRWSPGRTLTLTAALQRFLLRRSFDAISRSRGLQLTTDAIHLNGAGARMIADLVAEFLSGGG